MIQTPRLTLNPVAATDFDFLFAYLSDEEQTRYLPLGKPYPKNKVKAYLTNRLTHWKNNNFGTFMLTLSATGKTIGYCGLEYVMESNFIDIRYGLGKHAWGQGLAVEAALSCLAFGFNSLELSVIYGAAVPGNRASIALLHKLGMTPDPHFDVYGDGVDSFSITREQYNCMRGV